MMNVTRGAIVLWALCGLSTLAYGQCVFDEKYFEPGVYQNKEAVRSVEWLPDSKEAKIVTRAGDLISIKHWSCNTLGLEAKMFLHPPLARDIDIKDKITELANIVLREPEKARLLADLAQKDAISGDKPNEMGGPENRPEFYYALRRFMDFDVVTIKYYYN